MAASSGARKRDAWLVFALLIVVQIACFRGSSRLKASLATPSFDKGSPAPGTDAAIWKRSLQLSTNIPPSDGSDHHRKNISSTTASHPSTKTLEGSRPTDSPPGKDTEQGPSDDPIECQPIPVLSPPSEICAHVINHCEPSGHVDYLRFYYCAGAGGPDGDHHEHPPGKEPRGRWHPGIAALRILSLTAILGWMLFLFSWVGVVASDFFCPNLSTIASRLGLNESTAGVTFLAFGNGSPDVFSTFGAMKTGSGSLAIGELVGAASFIVSVISGSMMLIAPFRVKAWPFCRDVGFFTVAVALILTFLFDGKLRISECITLVCLYVLYAATVIVGGWWQERQRQKRLMLAAARDEYDNSIGDASSMRNSIRSSQHGDIERSQLLAVPGAQSSPRLGLSPSEYEPNFDPFESWAAAEERGENQTDGYTTPERASRSGAVTPTGLTQAPAMSRANSRTPSSNRPGLVPRHSLLSAIEFRDVVHSLRQDASADRSMEIFQSWDPERFLAHRRHHSHHRNTSTDRLPMSAAPDSSPPDRRRGHLRVTSIGPGVSSAAVPELSQASSPRGRRKTLESQGARSEGESSATLVGPSNGAAHKPLVDIPAASFDDPWREHLPGDACEPLGSPALPLDGSGSAHANDKRDTSEQRPSLPKLTIPEWQTGFAQRKQAASGTTLGGKGVRRKPSVPSIKISSEDRDGARESDVEGLPGKVRVRPRRGLYEAVAYRIKVALYALFPAFRHVRSKSWIGLALSFMTAPAIMTLNLTLPVVDNGEGSDECLEDGDGLGALRLEGGEADILARSREPAYGDRGEDDEAIEERIIHLRPQSPSGSFKSAEERVHDAERAMRAEHGQRDRDIASALRHLPETGGSPLSFGSGDHIRKSPLPFPGGSPEQPLAVGVDGGGALDESTNSDTLSCLPCEEHEAADEELRRSSRRFLALAQCIFAPAFVVWAIASSAGGRHLSVKVGLAAAAGIAVCVGSLVVLRQKDAGRLRFADRTVALVGLLRCSAGFLVSVMWIMTIVDEVVSILQTVGLIVGISDAILGLTVFAVGNSLGDLVANVTIARLGHPVMAISACFAGPLLNLLLGIGISGTYLLSGHSSQQPWSHTDMDGIYPIDFSPTLLVSGLGLLLILVGTLIAVPMNGFYLTRPLGVALMATYALIMTLNLLTEIFWVRPHS